MPPPPTPVPNVAVLLNLVPDRPTSVLQSLAQHPNLASEQDSHGYSLLHAAASYAQLDLLRELVQKFAVNVNLKDEDGETALFVAESVEVAKCLVEELGADVNINNDEGMTALEKIESEEEHPDIAEYLRSCPSSGASALASSASEQMANGVHPPPPLPPNVQINLGTVQEPLEDGPDPEFRRRIEELAARDDFHGEEGQAQLRELIIDVVRGVATDADGDLRGGSRRRVG